MTSYYLFDNPADAHACSRAMHSLGRPEHLFPQDVSARYSLPITLPDGRAALPLDMAGTLMIHREAPASGAIAVLVRNLAGPPSEEDEAGWALLTQALLQLPERGDPTLNGLEPVMHIPLAQLMPASAVLALLDQAGLDALLPTQPVI